jgi:hypothetical protein
MTSFAFILGVLPLVIAKGAGAEMNQALGTAVFAGMIGVTFFGIFFTPVFFSVIMKIFTRPPKKKQPGSIERGGQIPGDVSENRNNSEFWKGWLKGESPPHALTRVPNPLWRRTDIANGTPRNKASSPKSSTVVYDLSTV